MKKLLNRTSIRTQIRMILFSLLIICFGLGILVNLSLRKIILKNSKDYAYDVSQHFVQEMGSLYQRVSNLYQLQLYDSNIENFFLSPLAENSFDLYGYFSPIIGSTPDLIDIALTNHTFHWSTLYDNFTLNKMSNEITTNKITSLGIHYPSNADTRIAYRPYLVFGKQIYGIDKHTQKGSPIGNIILSIDPSKSTITLPTTEKMATTFLLTDAKQNFYCFSEDKENAEFILDTCSSFLSTDTLENNYAEYDTPKYHMSITYSPTMNYYFISAVDKNTLYHTVRQTQTLIIFIWIALTAANLLLIGLVHFNIISPMNQLYEFIHSIRNGDRKKLKSSITLDGSLEIHSLSKELSDMLIEVNTLNTQLFKTTTELYEMELQKQGAEIAHLRSQINPHFLYNTLEVLKGIALENEVPQIATISNAIGKMFRYSIKGSDIVTFESELEIAKAYLQIQSIRFPNRFEVLYSIGPDTKQFSLIKMLLQPIIENAIIHGLEQNTTPGILYIGSKLDQNLFVITIQDNGVGMDIETLNQLNMQLTQPLLSPNNHAHLGIVNVHRRIQLYYGNQYGLSIESVKGKGTIITLTIPANKH